MMRSTSEMAVSASARSRLSRATSVSWPLADRLGHGTGLGALRPFSFSAFLGRALAALLSSLERFFIASALTLRAIIVAGQNGTGHGVPSRESLGY